MAYKAVDLKEPSVGLEQTIYQVESPKRERICHKEPALAECLKLIFC